MPSTARWILAAAALLLLVATAVGAYAAHGLPAAIGAAEARSVELAVQYHFFTSLGLLGVGLLAERHAASRALKLAALALALGVVLFCGTIYATTLGAPEGLGRLTPVGGVSIMLGWLLLAVAALTAARAPS